MVSGRWNLLTLWGVCKIKIKWIRVQKFSLTYVAPFCIFLADIPRYKSLFAFPLLPISFQESIQVSFVQRWRFVRISPKPKLEDHPFVGCPQMYIPVFVEIKRQLDATDDIYCRFYCMLNMFRAIPCPSSGARDYYTDGRCLWYLVLWFSRCRYDVELKVMCPVCRQQPANRTHNHLYNTLELLMMGMVLPETCWACNKICNKYHLLHLVGILFPHNNDDARSKPLHIY